jgi:hypothetical protein
VKIHVGFNGWQGTLSPDPVMTRTGSVWIYTCYPPAGASVINCCFNNGSSVWDNNNGANYSVAVSNCDPADAIVRFSPVSPRDCDTDLTITYNPTNRPLEGAPSVFVVINHDGLWRVDPMVQTAGVWVSGGYGMTAGLDAVRVFFQDAAVNPVATDGTVSQYWAVAISACSTAGPSTVTFNPPSPNGCDDITITYSPNEGPLKGASQVLIHVGHDNWKDAGDLAMTAVGSVWRVVYTPPAGTKLVNCCFRDGGSIWDNHGGADWSVPVQNCTGGVVQAITLAPGSPTITEHPSLQNAAGDNFDLALGGGYASTTDQSGFGSFGQVYVNYDAYNFYIGGMGLDMVGTNNAMVIFLGFNTLGDKAINLWNLNGLPDGLDKLHNVTFTKPMDIVIVLGDEWGDGTFTNFNLGDGYNFGQGLFYLSTGSSSFWPMASARLSQFDGTGTTAVAAGDDDGNRLTDRWECRIPWSSLGAANGISDITNCRLAGVIVSTSTNGQNRYISGNYLGVSASPATNGNYGFEMVDLIPIEVGMPLVDSEGDGMPDTWELMHFGSLGVADANSDWDGDGMSDVMEFVAGTNPKDPSSCLRMYAPLVGFQGGGFVVQWTSASNVLYDLFRTTNLVNQSFSVVATNISANPPMNSFTDGLEGASGYYRIKTHAK